MAGLNPKIPVSADTRQAIASVAALRAQMATLRASVTNLRVGVTDTGALASIAALQAKMEALSKFVSDIRVGADTSRLDAAIAAELARLAALQQRASDLQLDADAKALIAKIAGIQKQVAGLNESLNDLDADIDITAALTKIYALEAQLKVLDSDAAKIKIDASTVSLFAAISAARSNIASLSEQARRVQLGGGDTVAIAQAQAKLLSFQAAAEKIAESQVVLPVSVDDQIALDRVAVLQDRVGDLAIQLRHLRAAADTTAAQAAIAALQARGAALDKALAGLVVSVDAAGVIRTEAQLLSLEATAEKMSATPVTIPVSADDQAALAKLAALQVTARTVSRTLAQLQADADTVPATAKVAALQARAAALSALMDKLQLNVSTPGVARAQAQMLGLQAAAAGLGTAFRSTSGSAKDADDIMGLFARGERNYAGTFGVLTGDVKLFGGALQGILPKALAQVGVLHILADAVIEIGAIWGPAIIAVGAFGFAGISAAQNIIQQMAVVRTVVSATGQSIYPLTSNFRQLGDAVQPQVYQLFGEALVIAGHNTGSFAVLVKATGTAMDQLGARFAYAVTQGQGVSKFATTAASDFAGLGESIGSFFGILGNLMKAVPGYAQILLSIGNVLLHVLEVFTASTIPVINWGLKIHGAILWGGLFITAAVGMTGAIIGLGKSLVTFGELQLAKAWGNIVGFGKSLAAGVEFLYAYGAAVVALAGEEGILVAVTTVLQDVPIAAWFFLAGAAIAGLIYLFKGGATQAQQFTASLQKTVQAASLVSLLGTIWSSQVAEMGQLSGAQAKLSEQTQYMTVQQGKFGGSVREVTQGYADQAGVVRQTSSAVAAFAAQYGLVQSRIGGLSKEFGSTTAAYGALDAAGITTAQITSKNAQTWAEALIQVQATVDAYHAMGVAGGQLGNDEEALGYTLTAQYQAVQKLNTAWSTFIGDVTGSQASFDTFGQGLDTLSSNATGFTLKLGGLSVKGTETKAAIDSLSASGLELNQAFTDQIGNANTLIASWRTAGVANNLLVQGIGDTIAPLEKYAQGSQEATAQLVALAEEAGYQGPVSLQALNKYLGITSSQLKNTGTDTKGLKDITDQATVQTALLTSAMSAQGNLISQKLIGDINNAILAYSGVEKAASAYGTAVAHFGAQSDEAAGARKTLINDLIASGRAAGDSSGQIAAMISTVLKIPAKVALQIVMTGDGSYTIDGGTKVVSATGSVGGGGGHTGSGAAAGAIITGGTPGRDSVPIMAMPGELIVPTGKVGLVRPILSGKIPGFASGGLVENGNTAVLSGQYATSMAAQFQATMTAAMVASMRAAIKSAASSASAGFGASPGGGAPSANAALARQIMPAWGSGAEWTAWNNVAMRESGWNQFAKNPSSGAYGIPQALPASKMGAAANPPDSNPAAQIRWMVNYIQGRYHDPVGAWAHELSAGWYGQGGRIPGAASGLQITQSLRNALATAQNTEKSDYGALVSSAAAAIAGAKKGSWLYSHKTSVSDELKTLSSRQSSELSGYGRLSGTGLTTHDLSLFGTTTRDAIRVTQDQGLTKAEPGPVRSLASALRVLGALAAGTIAPSSVHAAAGGSGAVTPDQAAAEGEDLLKVWQGSKSSPTINARIDTWNKNLSRDKTLAGASGLTKAEHAQYVKAEAADKTELATLAAQKALLQEWRSDLGSSDTSLQSWISAAGSTAALAKNVAQWKSMLAGQEKSIAGISAMLGWSAAQLAAQASGAATASAASAAASSSPSSSAAGSSAATSSTVTITPVGLTAAGALSAFASGGRGGGAGVFQGFGGSYDTGGWLPPGLSMAWNGTGQHERVTAPPGGGGGKMTAGEAAIVAALERNTTAVMSQGASFARELSGAARPAAKKGAYAGALRRLPL
jgi:hypothetical protein